MLADLVQGFVRVFPALQGLGKLARRGRVELVLLGSLLDFGIRSEAATEDALLHPSDANHEKVRRVLGTLQDLVQGGDVLLVGVVAALQLFVQHPRVPITDLEVVHKLYDFRLKSS